MRWWRYTVGEEASARARQARSVCVLLAGSHYLIGIVPGQESRHQRLWEDAAGSTVQNRGRKRSLLFATVILTLERNDPPWPHDNCHACRRAAPLEIRFKNV
jgi:hypothetical protein